MGSSNDGIRGYTPTPRERCTWTLRLKGATANTSCGACYNPYPHLAKSMLDSTYTGIDNSHKFCYHCGKEIEVEEK